MSGSLAVFWHLHVEPHLQGPRWLGRLSPASVLAVCGVALGTALMIAAAVLYLAIGVPFSSFGSAVAAEYEYQATPRVANRMSLQTFRAIRDTPGVTATLPVVATLGIAASDNEAAGTFVLGAPCDASATALTGIDCADIEARLADGPGTAVIVSEPLAATLGVGRGDPLGIAGGRVGDAHVGDVIDPPAALEGLNGGMWLVAEIGQARSLAGISDTHPFISAVMFDASAAAAAAVGTNLAVEVGQPGFGLADLLALTRTLMGMSGVLVLVGGVLIALSSITVSLDYRRRDLATAYIVGHNRTQLRTMLWAEGAALGFCGGLFAIPAAWAIGAILVGQFGAELLSGTGASLAVVFPWWLYLCCVVLGTGSGFGAATISARRSVRLAEADAIGASAGTSGRDVSLWPLLGVFAVGVGFWLGWRWGAGSVGSVLGYLGYGLVGLGTVAVGCAVTPWLLRGLDVLFSRGGKNSWLAAADLARDPLRVTAIVTIAALAVFLAVGLRALRIMTVDNMASAVETELAGRVLTGPREPGDQIDGRFTEQTISTLVAVPGVEAVLPQTLSVVRADGYVVNVLGTDPQIPREFLGLDADETAIWQSVAAGEVIVGDFLAAQIGISAGDTIRLPTLDSAGNPTETDLTVAAVARPRFAYDNGIGNVVVASVDTTQRLWAATYDGAIVIPGPESTTAEVVADIEATDIVNIAAADTTDARPYAEAAGARFLAPIEWVGRVAVVVAALGVLNFLVMGMLTQPRQRATLQFLGRSPAMERAAILIEAAAIGAIGALVGLAGSVLGTWYMALASPALLASRLAFTLDSADLVIAVGVVIVAMIAIGAVPVLAAVRRLDLADKLSAD